MNKHVLILGGGVAGMSAAHELIERGFMVTVLEKQRVLPGGKARSIPIEGTAPDGGKPLPGEHGFRFFPGFYRHIIHTMERIPYLEGKIAKRVSDNLVACPNMMMTRMRQNPIILPSHFPRSISSLKQLLKKIRDIDTGLTEKEISLIARKLWQLLTSCSERRINEYERMGWWEFTEAAVNSENYRTVFVEGLTRTLVAAKAETCNTKTNGDILIQMMRCIANPNIENDRILNGPTNEKWLFPWLEYLRGAGVEYLFDAEVLSIDTHDRSVSGVKVRLKGLEKSFSADYYLCALPVERAALVATNPKLLALDPNLIFLKELSASVAWMNGIQFYLKQDVPIVDGHIILADSPWALTAISQIQFWNIDISRYGNGDVKGIISVDVSNWEKDGLVFGLPARECTREQVIAEVWVQLKLSFNQPEKILRDEDLIMAYVDESIVFAGEILALVREPLVRPATKGRYFPGYGSKVVTSNEEPLLVNEINTWAIRSDSRTAISNFFLAADYVRTFTDLATMEGANEAARRAVNNIIEQSGSEAALCKVWDLHEPWWLLFYKWRDRSRFRKGLAWKYDEPWFGRLLNFILGLFKKFNVI
ncbi:hydroxysqualene dehydroxylase [Pedobacter sp. 22163]|uniref:hydroxysqualene dehydroxylase n=1 Tax=Pedobacter sp. 22163 TaxID=3453883 RepID=UPI003F8608C0